MAEGRLLWFAYIQARRVLAHSDTRSAAPPGTHSPIAPDVKTAPATRAKVPSHSMTNWPTCKSLIAMHATYVGLVARAASPSPNVVSPRLRLTTPENFSASRDGRDHPTPEPSVDQEADKRSALPTIY